MIARPQPIPFQQLYSQFSHLTHCPPVEMLRMDGFVQSVAAADVSQTSVAIDRPVVARKYSTPEQVSAKPVKITKVSSADNKKAIALYQLLFAALEAKGSALTHKDRGCWMDMIEELGGMIEELEGGLQVQVILLRRHSVEALTQIALPKLRSFLDPSIEDGFIFDTIIPDVYKLRVLNEVAGSATLSEVLQLQSEVAAYANAKT